MRFIVAPLASAGISSLAIDTKIWCQSCRQHCQCAVDDLVIAKIFDHATCMSDSRPIAIEEPANLGEGETKCHVCQIHGNLAG